MSRIGKKPIILPKQLKISVSENKVIAEGPNGKLEYILSNRINIELKDGSLFVKSAGDTKLDRILLGTTRSIIANMIKGVTDGYVKELEIVGVGFRAQVQQNNLNLQLGFTHPVIYTPPTGVKIEAPKPTQIIIKGCDKSKVGQAAAKVRAIMPPEPYKGKGIRYLQEVVRKKIGKTVTK